MKGVASSVAGNNVLQVQRLKNIALIGNPNSGKSSLFNELTGLNQKVANFPGVTVDKRTGKCRWMNEKGIKQKAQIIDLPGIYSLYPKSPDEIIASRLLCDPLHPLHPDVVIVIADATNLKRSLFLCSQVIDLELPVVLAINMLDLAGKNGIEIDLEFLSGQLQIPVVAINAREGKGINDLKEIIFTREKSAAISFINISEFAPDIVDRVKGVSPSLNDYAAFHVAAHPDLQSILSSAFRAEEIKFFTSQFALIKKVQQAETFKRYEKISELLLQSLKKNTGTSKNFSSKADKFLTHKVWGYVSFMMILFLVFQAIFAWAEYPMLLVEQIFLDAGKWISQTLPPGMLNDLFVEGIWAGLGGVAMFIPQIALLFLFIAILEDTGYMARASFLMDKLMRKFGLNGKSVIPMISSVACAVPAILSTRTIQSWKDRIITIMVIPLISCSARLPVYTLLISMVVPTTLVFGFFNLQGLVLMGLYLLGFITALAAAWVMKLFIKPKDKGFYLMEMPVYRAPRWKNISYTILEKVKIFLFDAGKIIVSIAAILWFLSSFSPSGNFQEIELKYHTAVATGAMEQENAETAMQSEKLANSYVGRFGRFIEPAIAPLGFDWKIGIALITSFAAREVFVGTMSTIYSVGNESESLVSVRQKMMDDVNPVTGKPVYTLATAFSLMIFYTFALQCMSTVAVVRRETKSWKWPLIQIIYLSALAYLFSLVVYQLMK